MKKKMLYRLEDAYSILRKNCKPYICDPMRFDAAFQYLLEKKPDIVVIDLDLAYPSFECRRWGIAHNDFQDLDLTGCYVLKLLCYSATPDLEVRYTPIDQLPTDIIRKLKIEKFLDDTI
jgi:hypothetical protein